MIASTSPTLADAQENFLMRVAMIDFMVTLTFPGTQPMVYTGILTGSGFHGTAKVGTTTWTFSVTR